MSRTVRDIHNIYVIVFKNVFVKRNVILGNVVPYGKMTFPKYLLDTFLLDFYLSLQFCTSSNC